MAGLRRALVALAAALALADASIVALALPPILAEMDTTITGVAAVVGVYALVLALGILPAARFDARRAGVWGLALFAGASLACGLAGSLGMLLLFRALQAAGGAAALLAAFQVLDAGTSRSGRRLWLGAALVGTAAGPAIGGLLTEVFDWRAIFLIQAPLAAAAALACLGVGERRVPVGVAAPARERDEPDVGEPQEGGLWSRGGGEVAGESGSPGETAPPAGPEGLDEPAPFRAHSASLDRPSRWDDVPPDIATPRGFDPARASGADTARVIEEDLGGPEKYPPPGPPVEWGDASPISLAALAFTAAAFTAVLFLLVIELVAGFAMSPLRAALGVTILPLAALAAAAIPGQARPRALAGAVLLAGGAAALAFLPAPSIAWTVVPQLLAGAGMGLALPAYAGELLPEKTVGEAAVGLAARHAGIVVVLAILAPVATAKLDSSTEQAILKGAALVLDSQIDPLQKLELAPALLEDIDIDSPRARLADAVDSRRGQFADDAAVYDRLGKRLDDVVVVAVQDAFAVVFLIAAGLALVAAALLASAWRRTAVMVATGIALATVVVYAVERGNQAPPPVTLANPCDERELPDAGGFAGAIQTQALRVLDRAACRFGSSREEFALALFDRERAAEYRREHGVDPGNLERLLSLLGG